MAFTDLGSIASGGSSGNNQGSLTVATTTNCAAGELIVVAVTDDNISTGGGDTLETSGVVIGTTAPFALTKGRQNSTNLAAQAGASVSLWWGVLPYAIASGQNIVASFTNATLSDATALSARHFSFASLHNSVAVEATNAATGTTTNPTSLTATTANIACLRIRATGCEYDSTQTITTTSTWTTWAEGASAATGTITEQVIECEHLISTTTSAASAPTLGSACDSASVYVAFKEVANPFRPPRFDLPPRGPQRGREFWIDAVGFVAGAEAETLAADAGAYALTGSDAAFVIPGGLVAASGSYILTGADAAFIIPSAVEYLPAGMTGGYVPWPASPRPYWIWSVAYQEEISGSVTLTAEAGSYAVTGADAAFIIPGAVEYMPAGMTGGYVPWRRPYPISLLTRTGRPLAPAPVTLTAASGGYAITGSSALLTVGTPGNMPAGATNWFNPWRRPYPTALLTRTGRPLAIAEAPSTLSADAGSYTTTGASAALALQLTANSGSYTVSGSAAVLARGFAAGAGAYAIIGTDANLVQAGAITLVCGAGSYTLTGGTDVSFIGLPPSVTPEQPGGGYTGAIVGAGRGRMIRRRKRGELDLPPDLEPPPLSPLPPDLPPPAPGPKPPDLISPPPGLMADMPAPQRKPLPPMPDDEDEDEIALLLEILNRS